jgi:O-antigen/teichoic acid export membrane protein
VTLLRRNIVANVLGQGLVGLAMLITARQLFRGLGQEAFGLVFFAITLSLALSTALDLGLGATAVREVSAHRQDDPEYVRRFVGAAGALAWAGYVVLLVTTSLSASWLATRWVRLSSVSRQEAVPVLCVLLAGGLLALPRSVYIGVLRGLQRMDITNALDVGAMLVQQAGLLVVLARGGSLAAVAAWMSTSYALWLTAYALAVRAMLGGEALRPVLDPAVLRRNQGFGGHMIWVSVLSAVQTQADRLIVSRLLPIAVFGHYSFGYSGIARATVLTGAVGQAAYPVLSALFARGDRPALLARYRQLQDLLCFGTVPVFAAVPFAVPPVLGAVFDRDIAATLVLPLTLLALGFYMNATLTIPYMFSLAVGRPQIAVRANVYALIVVLPATFLLVKTFGLVGAGFSWVAYHVFSYAYSMRLVCTQCLHIPLGEWVAGVLHYVLLASACYGPAFWLANDRSVQSLALAYLTATAVYTFLAWFLKAEIRSLLASARGGGGEGTT